MTKLKSYSMRTYQGPFLNINEDDVQVDLQNQLFFILDAFGGSNIGEKVLKLIKKSVLNFFNKFGGDPDCTMPFYFSHKYLVEGNALINAMNYAHDQVKEMNLAVEMAYRGGASGILCVLTENILTLASTGNCIAYLIRRGKLEHVSLPDSLSQFAQDDHNLQYQTSPLSAFGLFNDFHTTMTEISITDGDLVLLMTDGAYSRINFRELNDIINKVEFSDQEKIDEIFALANSRGNKDNQSAMILHF